MKVKGMKQRVAILGASDDPTRYSNRVFHLLQEYGHAPVPVHPTLKLLADMPVCKSLSEIRGTIDTLTMYVGPQHSRSLSQEILRLNPKRVIFNPGSENRELQSMLEGCGIEIIEGCTLVMLQTNQF